MGLYSYLTFQSTRGQSGIESGVIDQIESRTVPIAWVVLFNSSQIIPGEFLAVSSTVEARETISERSPNLCAALGREWQDGIEQFMNRLNASKYVEMNLQDWFGEPTDFEEYFRLQLSTFSELLHTGKKHLFSRKPKVSKVWRENVLDLYSSGGIFS